MAFMLNELLEKPNNLSFCSDQKLMLNELLKREREGLDYFFDEFDLEQIDKLLQMILNSQGALFFTGVGKSGLVAKKIAQTMTSTGSRSIYLSPIDALHGDIGIVTNKDIVFLLSKSGETDELLSLLPTLRNKEITTVAVVSNLSSRLAKECDFVINLPCKLELCPFDMAPTMSTTIQMIFGDILSIALMQKRNFSKDQFAENHPAGRIGKRIHLKVKDLMVQNNALPICHPEDKIVDVLVELSNKRCGCLLIIDQEHHLEGIFTDGDLGRSLQTYGKEMFDKKIGDVMTRNPKSIQAQNLAIEAMYMMEKNQKKAITVLPVIQEDKTLVGLIRLHDILQSGL